ncbi:glucose-6-phosphate isomerase [Megasphaera vaginalis (ex Bordigoni et al. 2020)]|uniref:glucose-6-phosphate isomerase n=1 Tax=Megasphaera vaginalis (ex Bordigoni et al. 2020) TaxID=2045301 RepID=UPI000C7DDB26|nr:glucose-6-phosphate isomerase [Megasphaera vaginalis (ex Bordigoni et al. 2020)]
MASITLQSGFTFDAGTLYGPDGVTEEELSAFEECCGKAHTALMDMRRKGTIDGHLSKDGEPEAVLFTRLPYIAEENINTPERIMALETLGRTTRNRVDAVVFFGIGGSYLGGKVLFDVHCGAFWNYQSTAERNGYPKIFFSGNNVDSRSLGEIIRFLQGERNAKPAYTVMAVLLSKSGSTIEPMSNYMIFRQAMMDASVALETVAVTDPHVGEKETLLHHLAEKSDWPIFFVPDGVGGRFSVFSEVGLIVAALIGFDIRAYLDGARAMDQVCRNGDWHENPALFNSALKYLAGKLHGRCLEVLMPYGDCLKSLSEWYVQLLAESLGKRLDKRQRVVNYGRTPIVAVGTTDMHAQTQEHQEGPQDKVVQFISVTDWENDLVVPHLYDEYAQLEAFSGLPLSRILESARSANAEALASDGRPSANYILPQLNAYHLGELMYMLCLSVAYEGEFAAVDAFNQPGVEIYKKFLGSRLKALKEG